VCSRSGLGRYRKRVLERERKANEWRVVSEGDTTNYVKSVGWGNSLVWKDAGPQGIGLGKNKY